MWMVLDVANPALIVVMHSGLFSALHALACQRGVGSGKRAGA